MKPLRFGLKPFSHLVRHAPYLPFTCSQRCVSCAEKRCTQFQASVQGKIKRHNVDLKESPLRTNQTVMDFFVFSTSRENVSTGLRIQNKCTRMLLFWTLSTRQKAKCTNTCESKVTMLKFQLTEDSSSRTLFWTEHIVPRLNPLVQIPIQRSQDATIKRLNSMH